VVRHECTHRSDESVPARGHSGQRRRWRRRNVAHAFRFRRLLQPAALHDLSAQIRTGDSADQKWDPDPIETGQSTHSAPGIAFYQTPTQNLLVAVFIANDSSSRILWSAMDLPTFYAGKGAAWSPATALEGESARELFACGTIGVTTAGEVPLVNVYFLANDDSGRLLTVGFIPSI
jgi:hypothetical protein